MSANFKFYLNRQGPKGRKGDRGEQGYSPSISVETETVAEYILKIQNEGYSFTTPNLRGNAIENTGGTYIRFNPETEAWYTGGLDSASPTQLGGVLITPVGGIESGGSDMDVPTSAEVYDYVESKIASIGQGYVTETTFNNYVNNTAITLNNLATQKISFADLSSALVEGDNVTLDVDSENGTITINAAGTDLSSCVKTTGDQNISGFKTFLNSPILKGTTNSTLEFYNGNDDTEVAQLRYTFSNNRFTISSEGGMYLQTSNNSINVDDIITSSGLTNVVTTNTTQTISGAKTFTQAINLKATSPYIYFKSLSDATMGYIRFDSTGTTMRAHSNGAMYLETSQHSGSNAINVDDIVVRTDIATKENTSNKVTSISSSSTNVEYPTALAVYNAIQSELGNVTTLLNNINSGSGS